MRCFTIVFVVGLSLMLGFPSGSLADDQNSPPQQAAKSALEMSKTSLWMERKLDYSQAILRGLAMGDFDAIEEKGKQLRLLSKVEGVVRRRVPSYRLHRLNFERICDEMVLHARQENLEGVTLSFNQLTVSCVSCHQALRAHDEDSPDEVPPTNQKDESPPEEEVER